jgi:hypothetical protein
MATCTPLSDLPGKRLGVGWDCDVYCTTLSMTQEQISSALVAGGALDTFTASSSSSRRGINAERGNQQQLLICSEDLASVPEAEVAVGWVGSH